MLTIELWIDNHPRCSSRHSHGTGVHSGTLASQCRRYLDAGFRCIVPDLPSHGYSSGLHVYQREMSGFCAGLHAVLHDVAERDQCNSLFPDVTPSKMERRKTFMLGLSFGGLVAFSYARQYPASYRYDETDPSEIPIDGLIGVGPMIAHNAKYVFVNFFLRLLFRILHYVFHLGRLEVIVPHKNVVDKDPKVYESLIMQDPRSHKGSFRIAHIICIHDAMEQLRANAEKIRHPVYIQMGGEDRVADIPASLSWIRRTASTDTRYEVYPVCQHVIYKKAKNQHDDLAGRISVIADNIAWMVERSPATPTNLTVRGHPQLLRSSYASTAGSCISRSTSRTSLFDEDEYSSLDDDSISIATTVPGTPLLTDADAFEKGAGGEKSHHLLSEDRTGWKVDDEGEKRLYRLLWSFREETRPFMYDTSSTASS